MGRGHTQHQTTRHAITQRHVPLQQPSLLDKITTPPLRLSLAPRASLSSRRGAHDRTEGASTSVRGADEMHLTVGVLHAAEVVKERDEGGVGVHVASLDVAAQARTTRGFKLKALLYSFSQSKFERKKTGVVVVVVLSSRGQLAPPPPPWWWWCFQAGVSLHLLRPHHALEQEAQPQPRLPVPVPGYRAWRLLYHPRRLRAY